MTQEINEKITALNKQHPNFPVSPTRDKAILEKKLEDLKNYLKKLDKEIAEERAKNEKCNPIMLANINRLKKNTQQEMAEKEEELALFDQSDYREYIRLLNQRDGIKHPSQSHKRDSVTSSAKKTVWTPSGKKEVTVNIKLSLEKKKHWLENFGKKNDFETHFSENKLELVSADKKTVIVVDAQKVTATWPEDKADHGISIMTELYVKGLEGTRAVKHTVISSNPEILAKLEKALAQRLQEQGSNDALINNKPLIEILKPTNQAPNSVNQETSSSVKPSLDDTETPSFRP